MEKGKVDIGLIRRYIRGELNPREMYALERRAQDDLALMDIILGMEQETQEMHTANLIDIRKRIALRSGQSRTRRLVPVQRWAVAASVLVAVTLGALWFTQRLTLEESQLDIASVPGDTEERRPDMPVTPGSGDETASEGAAAEQAPQSEAPAKKEAVTQTGKRLATAPTEDTGTVSPLADRLALQTEKQAQPADTLDKTVVVGYGTQKRENLTGAVTKAEPLRKSAVARVETEEIDTQVQINEQALAGRAPGIRVQGDNRKAATDTPTAIRIRGISRNAKPDTIQGTVVDGETQKPLSGVSVQLAENHTVTTDSSGRFTITGPTSMLNATFLGYELQTIKIVKKDSVIMVMEPSEASLSEVAVVGYGNESKREKILQPEPVDGWRVYNRYLKHETRRIKGPSGKVTLAFTIDDEGTPIDIHVIRTTDASLSERAIQLVREGAKWRPGKNGERKAQLQVAF